MPKLRTGRRREKNIFAVKLQKLCRLFAALRQPHAVRESQARGCRKTRRKHDVPFFRRIKRDESQIEHLVEVGREKETIHRIDALLVRCPIPRLDVACDQHAGIRIPRHRTTSLPKPDEPLPVHPLPEPRLHQHRSFRCRETGVFSDRILRLAPKPPAQATTAFRARTKMCLPSSFTYSTPSTRPASGFSRMMSTTFASVSIFVPCFSAIWESTRM